MRLALQFLPAIVAGIVAAIAPLLHAQTRLVDYVDPFLGTAPLTKVEDIGFEPPWRVWAGLTFPGASRPNGMVQLSPMTEYRSGAGYEYEDNEILSFTHTNKGHWNLCYLPMLPVTGDIDPSDFASAFSHEREEAHPGYYRVFLGRYNIDAEVTVTARCGLHRYQYEKGDDKAVIFDLAISNERVHDWKLNQPDDHTLTGHQTAHEKVYFYAVANHAIDKIETLRGRRRPISVVRFRQGDKPLEIRIGLSFVSVENAKLNLDAELAGKSFEEVRGEAAAEWEALLSLIKVRGGTDSQRGLFYSCLYRSFLWPALRSDVNGEFTDEGGRVVKKDFAYYTIPSLWDDYRNKLVLLAMLTPKVAEDVIQSMIDRGETTGFMPTFFHGDHAAAFITGCYRRGVRGFDVQKAYELLLKNATEESWHARPHLAEYIEKGYVSTPEVESPVVESKAKAGVTKTLEYAYDDYALALLARDLGHDEDAERLMKRAGNYANVFDESTGLMRGRLENGKWVEPFDAQYPYYEYMYREANAWQSSFFAPHDTEGLIALYPSRDAFEKQLDRLFSIHWNPRHIAMNVNSFIGQYCHGNQPDHGFPYLYYWVGKQEKSQTILDEVMDRFYGMDDGRTLCGMDDAGEMSSWYVFNAIGLYPYSPADEDYLVCVPVFDEARVRMGEGEFTIVREGVGRRIESVTCGDTTLSELSVSHQELVDGKRIVIHTVPAE